MRRPPLARVLLGLGLILAWLTLGRTLRTGTIAHPRGLTALIDLGWMLSPAAAAGLTALFVASAALFVVYWREAWTGGLLVAMLALGEHVQRSQWPGELGMNRALVLPGVALLAYLIGREAARREGRDARGQEQVGLDAACGIAAACYLLAGTSKLGGSGLAWADGSNLSLHMMVHSLAGADWIRPFRLAVAERLELCTALGVGTLVIECGFVVFLWAPIRRTWAVLAACMHLSIALLMGLHHYDWMLVALGLGFYPRAPAAAAPAALGAVQP